ncbi:MAG: L,D-transpeptidase family protein [Croceibacterium sp.]
MSKLACSDRWLLRASFVVSGVALSAIAVSASSPAAANDVPTLAAVSTPTSVLQAAQLASAPMELRSYYAYYGGQPLWITAGGALNPAAKVLLKLVQTAHYDEIDPANLNADLLSSAIDRAEADPSPTNLTDAEVLLSSALVGYEKALLQHQNAGMTYEHGNLQPYLPDAQAMLRAAATSGSLTDYISQMRWMHPLYAPLREALVAEGAAPTGTSDAVVKNLERLRAIPRSPASRYVLVDAANARLYMYEGDSVVDSMRVVVGKPETPTPMLAGYIRYAIFNPYWKVPTDLVGKRIVPSVIKLGQPYFKRQGYEVVTDWSDGATLIDPTSIDWHAVSRGDKEVKVRQLPGGANAMGKVKFEFPNAFGIYLHDTPEKDLLKEGSRQFSNGCIRLEDAQRLGRWLLGSSMPATVSSTPEQRLDLAQPVPVYVTYLTAHIEAGQIAMTADPYLRDVVKTKELALQTN